MIHKWAYDPWVKGKREANKLGIGVYCSGCGLELQVVRVVERETGGKVSCTWNPYAVWLHRMEGICELGWRRCGYGCVSERWARHLGLWDYVQERTDWMWPHLS